MSLRNIKNTRKSFTDCVRTINKGISHQDIVRLVVEIMEAHLVEVLSI